MQLDLRAEHIDVEPQLLTRLVGCFETHLDHLKQYISWCRIHLNDLNGPKGGDDKSCRAHLRLRWSQDIIVSERGSHTLRVVEQVARRSAMAAARAAARVKQRHRRQRDCRQGRSGGLAV